MHLQLHGLVVIKLLLPNLALRLHHLDLLLPILLDPHTHRIIPLGKNMPTHSRTVPTSPQGLVLGFRGQPGT